MTFVKLNFVIGTCKYSKQNINLNFSDNSIETLQFCVRISSCDLCTHRHRQSDRQTDRQTHTHTHTCMQTHKHTQKHTYKHTLTHTHIHTHTHTHTHTEGNHERKIRRFLPLFACVSMTFRTSRLFWMPTCDGGKASCWSTASLTVRRSCTRRTSGVALTTSRRRRTCPASSWETKPTCNMRDRSVD